MSTENHIIDPTDPRYVWGRTRASIERITDNPDYAAPDDGAPYGRLFGKPLIGRDSPINGGVYVGEGAREAIFVMQDSILEDVFDELVEYFVQQQNTAEHKEGWTTEEILDIVMHKVKEKFYKGEDDYRKLADNLGSDKLIRLSYFVQNNAGLCRHQSLLTGFLIEQLVSRGILDGQVSVDRSSDTEREVGHSWVRFTKKSDPDPYIVDTVLLGKAYRLSGIRSLKGIWDYCRPEDN